MTGDAVIAEAAPQPSAATSSAVDAFLEEALTRAGVKRPAPVPAPAAAASGGGALLLPITVRLEAKDRVYRETFLWQPGRPATTAAAAKRLCAQMLAPASLQAGQEQYVQRQLDRTVELFKDVQGPAKPSVPVLIKVIAALPDDTVYYDEVAWDLRRPRACLDLYASAICNDLRLPFLAYVSITRRLRERLDQLRQDHAAGKPIPVPPAPDPTGPRRSEPSKYPIISKPSPEALAAMRARLASRRAAAAAVGTPGPEGAPGTESGIAEAAGVDDNQEGATGEQEMAAGEAEAEGAEPSEL